MHSIVKILAQVTGTAEDDWEYLDGPESGVGVDYWLRDRRSGAEAYANLDQDHLTISIGSERIYDGPAHSKERSSCRMRRTGSTSAS